MINVKCKACGKHYDYHECGCCPNCGAYNRPPRRERITAEGDVYHISDAEYQKKEVRHQAQKGKVCFEKKVCYEEQAHSSSTYQKPSSYRDGYVASKDTKDDRWDYDEDMEARFDNAEDALEDDFDKADSQWEYMEEPGEKKKRVRPYGFRAEEAGRKLENILGQIESSWNLNVGANKSKHTTKHSSGRIGGLIVVILVIVISIIGTVMSAVDDAMEDFWADNFQPAIELPEEYMTLYEQLEPLEQEKSLAGTEQVYEAQLQQSFVWWNAPISVDGFTVKSAEEEYGDGFLVTVQMKGDYGFENAPVLYYESSDDYWEPSFYWEQNVVGEFGNEYVFWVDMPQEEGHMRLVCDGPSPDGVYEEIQIPLQ